MNTPRIDDLHSSSITANSGGWVSVNSQRHMTISDRLREKVLGSSSRFINEQSNMFAKVNGGTMPGVLSNEYQKDYIVEMRMRDQLIQDKKQGSRKVDFRRGTITQEKREEASKRKLIIIGDKHQVNNQTRSPILKHAPGAMPTFYPTRTIERLVGKSSGDNNSNWSRPATVEVNSRVGMSAGLLDKLKPASPL